MAEESRLPQQIRTVERSLVFLRQEHLTLLQGLHLEILSLQKRCSELQEEEELLETRCQRAGGRLAERESTLAELRKELSRKGALVGALRANLKEKERHFLEELKLRSHCSNLLNAQLQKQTETAAYLSFQLHAARQKLHHQRLQQRQGLLAGANTQGAQHGPEQNSSPSGASPSFPVVKPKRKSTRASSRVERGRECVPTERVTGPEEPTAMPDPALFLHPRRHRAHPRHTQRPPSPPPDREGAGGDGEASARPREEAPRLAASATAPPAAETKAD
ncbi:unnamed protein product [Tetraodon nigroviridis]|uniref:(spotted green pufferfish) hypothetical protein n=1 Tax=Tetraodon nigroviridis TaxID=99883 RepID=Q4RJN8_TETNG|nr:unnamed protein product [Tetraodon nigroviridis]